MATVSMIEVLTVVCLFMLCWKAGRKALMQAIVWLLGIGLVLFLLATIGMALYKFASSAWR
jgi:hypothetical protein